MRNRLLVGIVVAASVAVGCRAGQPPATSDQASPAGGAADGAQTVRQLENEWVMAIVQKDTATIERLLADDFVGTTNDVRYGKAEAVIDVKTGVHDTLDMNDVQVRAYGDTAVVTFDQTERSRHGSEDYSGHYMFTNVWVKQGDRWVAVSSHGSRIR
jgi:ketosteroid isomerase-like protein